MRIRYWIWFLPAFCVAVGLWWDLGHGQAWLATFTGTDYCVNLPVRYQDVCKHYGFWSGFGSVIPWSLFSLGGIFTAIALFWRTNTCGRHWWCWRKPSHPLAGNEHFKLCAKHHPDDQMTVKEAVQHHIRFHRGGAVERNDNG